MEQFQVKDKSLAPQGHLQIEWAAKHMPVLNIIKNVLKKKNPQRTNLSRMPPRNQRNRSTHKSSHSWRR
jgi:hypothetical protein